LIENSDNAGFARANNQAVAQSSGDYVLLLNPDTEVLPGALEALVQFLRQHPKAGAVGARILNPDGSLQISCYPAPTLMRELWRLLHLDALRPYGVYHMSEWDTGAPREVDTLLGACILLPRTALAQVGSLDEDYFFTGEEIDLCCRLQQARWRIYWVPRAQVIHYGGQSARLVMELTFLRLYEGKVLYFRKRQGRLAARAYKVILSLAALLRLLLSPLAWLGRSPRRQQQLTLAGRYARLLLALPHM
jgi:N-acetylglucosaminyl-diphospho-decaprenol L-rhamnosyltransferase